MPKITTLIISVIFTLFPVTFVHAHDPIFSPGPHVLFKDGIEIHAGIQNIKNNTANELQLNLKLTYGFTPNWATGIAYPILIQNSSISTDKGIKNISLFSKYRFWRKDRLGTQESTALSLLFKQSYKLIGLTYGYESLRWYRWSSFRYQYSEITTDGLQAVDKWWFDLAAGIRLRTPDYLKADTVWIIELNHEGSPAAQMNNINQNSDASSLWFISPGLFWTQRNFAIKMGVQLAVDVPWNDTSPNTSKRATLEFEWHI